MDKDILIGFKELKFDRVRLANHFGINPVYAKTDFPVFINGSDVIRLIEFYTAGKINYNAVIDWCDVVRFSDMFDYPDEENEQEIIATVIDEIQDTEESCKMLPDFEITKWLRLLKTIVL